MDEESQKLAALYNDESSEDNVALPETQALWYLGQSKDHRHLLKHPVITSFLYLKWGKIRRFFNRNLRIYLLFVEILTWYIFENFGGERIRDPQTGHVKYCHGFFGFFALGITAFALRDWTLDVKKIMREEKLKKESSDSGEPLSSCRLFTSLILSNWVEVIVVLFVGTLFIAGPSLLWWALLSLTCVLISREVFQVSVSLKRYIFNPENWMEVAMIVLIGTILFLGGEQWKCAT